MYEELVKRLRAVTDGSHENKCDGCPYDEDYPCCVDCLDTMLKQAADAIEERDKAVLTIQHEMMAEAESHIALVEKLNKRIEELELHYCPHAIRNVHDRGDDSICRVLGTEPPKEEA